MPKYGIAIKIDVTKIEKARLYKGKKGTYLDATCFFDPDDPGEYGDHGFISHSLTKEEREADKKGAIIGNVKVFWTDGGSQPQKEKDPEPDFDEDLPF